MSKYESMSELEISKRVAKHIGLTNWFVNPHHEMNLTGGWIYSDECKGDANPLPNFCRSESHAMPVIMDIIDKLEEPMFTPEGEYVFTRWKAISVSHMCGRIRAAMVIFLMTKELSD